MKRIFAAYPIVGELSEAFLKISQINSVTEGIRWTNKDNLHITLFFIGEVEEGKIEKIIPRLESVANDFKPFKLQFDKIEVRTTKRKPSMIWGRFKKCDEYSALSKAIQESVSEFMTIAVSHKDPIPHCTLARVQSRAQMEKIDLTFSFIQTLIIDRVELWMTVQTKDGVRYERLAGFAM